MTKRQSTIQRQKDRLATLRLAHADEYRRYGEARAAHPERAIVIQTAFGEYQVYSVNVQTWEAITGPRGQTRSDYSQRTFMIHDTQWASMLAQAGVARHPLFQEVSRAS